MKKLRGGRGGGPRFAGRSFSVPASPELPTRGPVGSRGAAPRFTADRFISPSAFRGCAREPITADDAALERNGSVQRTILPPQNLMLPAVVIVDYEPRYSLRQIAYRLNKVQGLGASRFLRIPRIVLGSHERPRGSVSPQRMANAHRNRLTYQPSNPSYSEQTEVLR